MASRELGPVGAARLLRADLRRAREKAALTQSQIADRLRWSLSKVTRIENGDVGITDGDLRLLCQALALGPMSVAELLRRNQIARRRGWWHDAGSDFSPSYITLISLESEADRLVEYNLNAIPGLFQTRTYAEALFAGMDEDFIRNRAARSLDLRMRRQKELLRTGDPPNLTVLVDEAVLYRPAGTAEDMAEQIRVLAEMGRRSFVDLRVLPFEKSLNGESTFILVENRGLGTTAYIEGLSNYISDDVQTVEFLQAHFARLWEFALDEARTGQLLSRVAAHYDSGRRPRPWLWA